MKHVDWQTADFFPLRRWRSITLNFAQLLKYFAKFSNQPPHTVVEKNLATKWKN